MFTSLSSRVHALVALILISTIMLVSFFVARQTRLAHAQITSEDVRVDIHVREDCTASHDVLKSNGLLYFQVDSGPAGEPGWCSLEIKARYEFMENTSELRTGGDQIIRKLELRAGDFGAEIEVNAEVEGDTGTVKWFDVRKGYGFTSRTEGE